MTLAAHPGGNRHVNIIVQYTCLIRTVRVMTAGAARGCHGIILVFTDEQGAVRLMTANAERSNTFFQEVFCFDGGMGVMAGETPPTHGVVLEPELGERRPHILMAFKTEFVTSSQKIELVTRRMGIMAFHASALGHDFMDALRLVGDHLFVADIANSVDIRCQKLPVGRCVGVVAATAFALFQRRMNKGFGELFLESGMAAQAELSGCSRLQLELQGAHFTMANTSIAKKTGHDEQN